MIVVAVLALVLAAAALAVAAAALRTVSRGRSGLDAVPADAAGLRREVATLKAEAAGAVRHLAVVRYDAFGDMGGHLSWSVALLDARGDGVVLTSIHGRSDARTYAKAIRGGQPEQQLSPEETEAVVSARR